MHTDQPAIKPPLKVLRIDASSRYEGSVTRQLVDDFLQQLHAQQGAIQVTQRDLAREALPFIDAHWIGASFTPADQRNPSQQEVLAYSDRLIQEMQDADVLVLGVPVYNFSIPAALKAWIDLVARAGVTFRYTDKGPLGLLKNKKAYLILASGGTPIGSAIDFASGYLRHVLGFLGIEDLELISAPRLNTGNTDSRQTAQLHIRQAVKKLQQAADVAA